MPSARKLAQQQAKISKQDKGNQKPLGSCPHCNTAFYSKYERKTHACMASLRAGLKQKYAAE